MSRRCRRRARRERYRCAASPGRATFRLNRDVRFSKDKKPYKTNAGCVVTRTGLKGSPGLVYTHVAPDGCFLAAGFYHPEPEPLGMMRKAIAARPAAWLAIEKKLAAADLELSRDEALKRNPQGFQDVDARVADAVRARSFIVRRPLPDALLLDGGKLVEAAAQFARDALPLLNFGWRTMG